MTTTDHGHDIGYLASLRDHYDHVGRSSTTTTTTATDQHDTEPTTTTTTEPTRPTITDTTTYHGHGYRSVTTYDPIPDPVSVRVYVAGPDTDTVAARLTDYGYGMTTTTGVGSWRDDTGRLVTEPAAVLELVVSRAQVPTVTRLAAVVARAATTETAILVTTTDITTAATVYLR